MRFVRVTLSHDQSRVVGVMQQDVPFQHEHCGKITVTDKEGNPEQCETFDLGCVEEQAWTDAAGNACTADRHIHDRLRAIDIGSRDLLPGKASSAAIADMAGVERHHDVPCTLDGIRQRLRKSGTAGISVKVRAWLALTLPGDHVSAMGLARGVPLSALKALEGVRNRRDPHSGSRMELIERAVQQAADARAARRLAARERRHG